MNLLTEYQQQQTWRCWRDYLKHIPINKQDTVLDLGCSVGNVSHLFAECVENVIGVDINSDFVDFCEQNKSQNEEFICSDFLQLDLASLPKVTGVWSSFALSYLAQPQPFINRLYDKLEQGGWIALLDIQCFISGNMNEQSRFYQQVKEFELTSYQSGVYDFNFAAKLPTMLEEAGFKLLHHEQDVTDVELNFSGAAKPEVVDVWQARLRRMVKLKALLGQDYEEFEREFIAYISSNSHRKNNNLSYCVAVK